MKRFASLLAFAFLAGCILVEDFGKAWDGAKPDHCLARISESLYATEFRRNPEGKDMNKLARALDLGGRHYYLLLKQSEDDKGGRLYRFTVTNGIFQRWRLNPTMRETFKKDYPNTPVSLARDTVTLASFTSETEKLLIEISGKPEYWQIEDQALYNVLRDPLCRFDDRPPEPPGALNNH